MDKYLPPSPTFFLAYRASPSFSQGMAGRGAAAPHRTVEEQRDGAPGGAVILLKSFKAFYKPHKDCWWHNSCLKTYGLTLLFTVLRFIARSQMNPFHFPFTVKPFWPFLFHWHCLIATPNQLYHSTEALLLKAVLGQQSNLFCSSWTCSDLSEPLSLGITQPCLGSYSGC